MEDIINEGVNADPETLEYIHKNKTGSPSNGSRFMGAVRGGANTTQIERFFN